MVTRRSRYLVVNLKSTIFHLLAIVAAVSVEAAEPNFLTPEELNVISRADEIQKGYSQRGFKIVQIISSGKAIVSDQVKDFILYADFSGKVDDDIFVATVKENGPESYETVTGAKRTLMSYIAVSKKELDIVARSKPLIAKKTLAEKELYRQEGEHEFQGNCANMKVLYDDLDLFLSDIQADPASRHI